MSWIITGTEKNPVDPYFSNVSLLLHGDGANGSTTIVDSSPSPKTVTPVGDAQISTAQSKFGGSSIAFDGSGDTLQIVSPINIVPSTEAFTVETWLRQTSTAAAIPLSSLSQNVQIFRLNNGTPGRIEVGVYGSGAPGRIFFANALATNTWHHVAWTYNAGANYLFVDGGLVASATATVVAFDISVIGANNGSSLYYNGYIDDLRITKGVARYTANFTPPTAPFPDA